MATFKEACHSFDPQAAAATGNRAYIMAKISFENEVE
jgi:hypothetical protein